MTPEQRRDLARQNLAWVNGPQCPAPGAPLYERVRRLATALIEECNETDELRRRFNLTRPIAPHDGERGHEL